MHFGVLCTHPEPGPHGRHVPRRPHVEVRRPHHESPRRCRARRPPAGPAGPAGPAAAAQGEPGGDVTGGRADQAGPAIAATDYMRAFAEQIRPFITDRRFTVLGTDGFGRSDTRKQLRKFFEVNRYYVVVAALKALADEGQMPLKTVTEAIKKYGLDPKKPNPMTV